MSRKAELSQENCKEEAGLLKPLIDQNRCEGKEDCVAVCPYQVFEIRKLSTSEKKELRFSTRLKLLAHGGKQAFVVRSEACHSCGLCVVACPEKAIKLVRAD